MSTADDQDNMDNPGANPYDHRNPDAIPGGSNIDIQKQLQDMQNLVNLQMQAMQLQTQMMNNGNPRHPTLADAAVTRQVKVPEGRYNMSLSEFRTYRKDCLDYQTLTGYTNKQIVLQMRLNMDQDLKRAIDTNYGASWDDLSVNNAINAIKTIVSQTSNAAVFRKEFDNMNQLADETIREYVTRLKSCAIDCNFICPHDETHDLSDYHLVNRIRSGIIDKGLQQEVLQKSDELNNITTLVHFCENFEAAKKDRQKLSSATNNMAISNINIADDLSQDELIAAISQYKKNKKARTTERERNSIPIKCSYCGYSGTSKHSYVNCPAQGHNCKKCGKLNHFENVCRSRKPARDIAVVIDTIELIVSSCTQSDSVPTKPEIIIQATTNLTESSIPIKCIADTGAQVTVANEDHMKQLQISRDKLLYTPHTLKHAGGEELQVLGSYPVTIYHNNHTVTSDVHFVSGARHFYLSLDVCKNLSLIHQQFPNVNINNVHADPPSSPTLPIRPPELPFPPTENDIPNLQSWLLSTFKDSTFNIDKYPLPPMSGKPLQVHLEPNAIPYASHSPIPIPHNWKNEVKNQLDKDVAMGILRKAPVGEPTEWCMNMVTVAKKDGSPRRTIDFQPINKYCLRETHHTPCPFDIVSSIPSKSFKTVLDAFNGYHQVPLDEPSIKLTTFITEFGRYQYLRAPQGHIGSGDAYTRRYDDVIKCVPRKHKVVDDVLLHDDNITQAFYHTFDYLTLCAENGITINPQKFRFAHKEVDFVGYHVGWDNYRASDDMLNSIKCFPMPANPSLSDIRAWFGLINQVAPFIASSSYMLPFRDLLKPTKAKGKMVYWDAELQRIFIQTKAELCALAEKGLAYYDTARETAIITDWSKSGIGFVVMQKYCSCTHDTTPLCCSDGWKLAFCNSRHLTPAEQNYAPIEGEALAVVWALKKARLFLLGCQKFTIYVDQQPLVKIFGDKMLSTIDNHRLLTFKEKTLPYSYEIVHIKGIKNHANTFSRYPVGVPDNEDVLISEQLQTTCIHISTIAANQVLMITTDQIRDIAAQDPQYQELLSKIRNRTFADSFSLESSSMKEFYNVQNNLSIDNDLIMYSIPTRNLRFVIPKALRKQAITNLHIANQGTSNMLERARDHMYWPGMDRDVNEHVLKCLDCRKNAPSQQKEPLILAPVPEYPFQHVVADMFQKNGHHYIAYADRLTAFIELAHFPTSTVSALIINTLREFFHRWGAPEEITMDGGPNLVSLEVRTWLNKWGVKYRLSSAYYPQSNGRAEAAVKTLKRLMEGNTGKNGSITNDQLAYALMQHRNTPIRGMDKSPAELALGRPIRDSIPLPRQRYRVSPDWANNIMQRERSMTAKNMDVKTKYDMNSKTLSELSVGTEVLCQNTRDNKWSKSGVIVEVGDHRQYYIKMHGSGRVSLRNRKHLRPLLLCKPTNPIIAKDVLYKYETQTETVNETVNNDDIQPLTDTVMEQSDQLVDVEPAQHLPRRSTRIRRVPKRYREEEN